jgi:molybdenum cofactor biosynthesis enzyme MoaA
MDFVRLTGGEPFLRTDLIDIVMLVQKWLSPRVIHITTNGFLTDRIVHFCQRRPKRRPLYLLVSLDGMGERHNQIRGVPQAWKYTSQTLNLLAKNKDRWHVNLTINQTIVDESSIDDYCRTVICPPVSLMGR